MSESSEDTHDVQQSSSVEVPAEVQPQPQTETVATEPVHAPVIEQGEDSKPHPLDPEGDRFKQVWARAKSAEEDKKRLADEVQREREERIRLEERLKAKEEAKAETQPTYTWDQLQAAVDAGQITFAKALDIRDQQLYAKWEKTQREHDERQVKISSVSSEMNEYVALVPNVSKYGTVERDKVEREYGYLVGRLGEPKTKEQKLSMELAAARAAFGDLDTLRTKQKVSATALPREPFMEHSATNKTKTEVKKDFRSTLSTFEIKHYERAMDKGRYPGGWDDVQKEYEEYDRIKAGK